MSRGVVVCISLQWQVTIEVSWVDGVGINGQPVFYVQSAGRRVVDVVDGVPRVVVWPYVDALRVAVFYFISLLGGVGDLGLHIISDQCCYPSTLYTVSSYRIARYVVRLVLGE